MAGLKIHELAMEVSSWENHRLHGGKLPNGHFKCHGEFDDIYIYINEIIFHKYNSKCHG